MGGTGVDVSLDIRRDARGVGGTRMEGGAGGDWSAATEILFFVVLKPRKDFRDEGTRKATGFA